MHDGNRGEGTKALAWPLPLIGILLAIVLAWGIGWSQAREEYKRQQTPAAYAAAAKKDAQRACAGSDPAAVFECVNEKVETAYQTAHDEQDLSAQQRAASSALAAAVLTFFALLISIVGVWFVKRTLDATLDAVKDTGLATKAMFEANAIAERNAQRGMRPYLWPEAAWIEMKDDESLVAHVHIRNFGQTPAINARAWIHSWIADFPLKDALPEPKDGEVEMGSEVIGQGRHSEYRQPHRRIPPPLVQDIKEGHLALYVYGHGTYLDTFGREHFFRYIYFSNGEAFERKRFAPYSSGNVIDIG